MCFYFDRSDRFCHRGFRPTSLCSYFIGCVVAHSGGAKISSKLKDMRRLLPTFTRTKPSPSWGAGRGSEREVNRNREGGKEEPFTLIDPVSRYWFRPGFKTTQLQWWISVKWNGNMWVLNITRFRSDQQLDKMRLPKFMNCISDWVQSVSTPSEPVWNRTDLKLQLFSDKD